MAQTVAAQPFWNAAHGSMRSASMLQQELDRLVPARDFNCRDFVRTAVGSGFAAAVLPVAAQTAIKTDSQGLLAGAVSMPVGNVPMPAYRRAAEKAPRPGGAGQKRDLRRA
jgi:hypothetical protein